MVGMEILTSDGEWKFNSVTIQYSLFGISVVCGMSITPGCGAIDVGRMLQSCPPMQSSGFSCIIYRIMMLCITIAYAVQADPEVKVSKINFKIPPRLSRNSAPFRILSFNTSYCQNKPFRRYSSLANTDPSPLYIVH